MRTRCTLRDGRRRLRGARAAARPFQPGRDRTPDNRTAGSILCRYGTCARAVHATLQTHKLTPSQALLATALNRAVGVVGADLSAQVLGSRSHGAAWRVAAIATLLAAAGPAALVLALLVRRARRCADHAVTLFVLHVCLSSMAHGIPMRPLWWALHAGAAVLICVVAETACHLIEAREREAFKLDIEASAADIEDPHVDEEDDAVVSENAAKTRSEEEVSLLV